MVRDNQITTSCSAAPPAVSIIDVLIILGHLCLPSPLIRLEVMDNHSLPIKRLAYNFPATRARDLKSCDMDDLRIWNGPNYVSDCHISLYPRLQSKLNDDRIIEDRPFIR